MEIRANVELNLPSVFYKITLKYDTYKKATFDEYLIAALIINTKSKQEANTYIDEITGNGSLNEHFKNLYKEMSNFTDKQIADIINNSLFPITVIDQKNNFNYYPMFNATIMKNKVYSGNLLDKQSFLQSKLMPNDNKVKFLSMEFATEALKHKKDRYTVLFNESGIKVDLGHDNFYSISNSNFEEIYSNDLETLEGFLGEVKEDISEGNWNMLTNTIVKSFMQNKHQYKDADANHSILMEDYIKTIEVINVFGLHFFKEKRFEFSQKNKDRCEEAVQYLIFSKNINEFKTKSLIKLLDATDEIYAQSAISYILFRKNSKDLSELALKLIKKGLEKNWPVEVLKTIKSNVSTSEYKYIYKVNSDLDFSIEDLLGIDEFDLTEVDKKKKEEYLSKKDNLLKDINLWIGEITNSGIREKIKSLEKTELKDKVKKFVDKRTGHNKKEYKNMNMGELQKEHDEIKLFYYGDFVKIQEVLKNK